MEINLFEISLTHSHTNDEDGGGGGAVTIQL